jgi:hypothetical protein
MTEGYIKLYRSLLDNPVMKNPEIAWLWCILLLSANHKKKSFIFNGKKQVVKAGQLITGRKQLSKLTGLSESKIYRALNYFESEQQIKQQKNNKFTLITILNWSKYQGNGTAKEQQFEQQMNNQRTTSEQPVNTNKNVKNDKNVKNKEYTAPDVLSKSGAEPKKATPKITFNREKQEFVGITESDIDLWVEAYPAVKLDTEIKKMIDWILSAGAKGHKSNWRKFITNWFSRCQDRGGTK